jgi:hypothetical protein
MITVALKKYYDKKIPASAAGNTQEEITGAT